MRKVLENVAYGVVLARREKGNQYQYLIVKQHQGHWSFPKGHPETGETPEQTALRELAEESGLSQVELLSAPELAVSYTFTSVVPRTPGALGAGMNRHR